MTEARIAKARRLWDDIGNSASAIARAIGCGCTKHAIIGYANRNAWPPRGSPIVRDGVRTTAPVPRIASPRKRPEPSGRRETCWPEPLAVPTAAFRGCQYIASDDPRTWTMCGAPVVNGGAWCASHREICYHRSPRQTWQVAA
jgi:hypothetical protein